MSFPGFNECHGHFANEAGSEAASPRAGTVLPETWCIKTHTNVVSLLLKSLIPSLRFNCSSGYETNIVC